MSDLDMGEGREFVNYKLNATMPHGGVCYNWNAAGDLKDYTGTVAQWTAIQVAMAEIKQYNTVIIATYVEDKDITVRLRLNDDGELYFIGPDGSVNTITADGMTTEEAGGGMASKALAGLVGADTNPKYNDCDEHPDVVQGYVNFNWDDAGYLKDYSSGNSAAWGKLNNAKADMQANGTVYLAKYDANRLVELKINEDGDLYFIGPDGSTTTLTADGSYTEPGGGGAAKSALAGLLGAGDDSDYVDCSQAEPESGAVNYNWDKAGNLKDYTGDATAWAALKAAKEDIINNGGTYLATYDDDTLVELQVDEDTGDLFYILNDGTQVTLNDITTLAASGKDASQVNDYPEIFKAKIKELK